MCLFVSFCIQNIVYKHTRTTPSFDLYRICITCKKLKIIYFQWCVDTKSIDAQTFEETTTESQEITECRRCGLWVYAVSHRKFHWANRCMLPKLCFCRKFLNLLFYSVMAALFSHCNYSIFGFEGRLFISFFLIILKTQFYTHFEWQNHTFWMAVNAYDGKTNGVRVTNDSEVLMILKSFHFCLSTPQNVGTCNNLARKWKCVVVLFKRKWIYGTKLEFILCSSNGTHGCGEKPIAQCVCVCFELCF